MRESEALLTQLGGGTDELGLPAELQHDGWLSWTAWRRRPWGPLGRPRALPARWLEAVYQHLEAGLLARYGELPAQIIHRDAHPANLLVQDGEVSGYIDWEMVTRGPRLFDLAYCATALLSTAAGSAPRRQAWLAQLSSPVSGYASIQPLLEIESVLLADMQMAIQLIFAAFCAQHADRAGAAANLDALRWLLANAGAVSEAIGRGTAGQS